MPLDVLRIARAQIIPLSFEQNPGICGWDRWSAGRNAALQESDARRLGCAEAVGRNSLSFSFVGTGVLGRGRGAYMEEN